jgi:hypothetical protein
MNFSLAILVSLPAVVGFEAGVPTRKRVTIDCQRARPAEAGSYAVSVRAIRKGRKIR